MGALLGHDGRDASLPLSYHEAVCHGNASLTPLNVLQSCGEALTRLRSLLSLAGSVGVEICKILVPPLLPSIHQ